MASFPLVLAGPIVRRVEPESASVWVSLSEPRSVRLSLFHGPKEIGELDDASTATAVSAAQTTRRLGDNLHIALVTVKPAIPLLPGQIYSYNLSFGPSTGAFAVQQDLRSLGLLANHEPTAQNEHAHLALGYAENFLPSFATCPVEITDLKVVHGSCRRINADLEDALAWVDDLIAPVRTDALRRPHQMMLSGDQIYADDVPLVLLAQLRDRGIELMGATEFVPMSWKEGGDGTQPPTMRVVDAEHLPAGMRHRLIDSEARMTSKDNHSHLISFGEYCAMYLFVWSNVLWDLEALEDFDDVAARFATATALPPNWGSLFIKREPDEQDQLTEADIRPVLELLQSTFDAAGLRSVLKNESRGSENFRKKEGFRSDLLHPAGLILERLLTDNMSAGDRTTAATLAKKDKRSDQETDQLDKLLFTAISGASKPEVEATMKSLIAPRVVLTSFNVLPAHFKQQVLGVCRDLANQLPFRAVFAHARQLAFADPPGTPSGSLDFSKTNIEQLWRFQQVIGQLCDDYGGLYKKQFSEDTRKKNVTRFYARLAQVRRALANVSTYMIFDDHEVTDDWNLNPIWIDRVYTAPLGRTIVRNGLAAFGMFQGWGNDPDRFSQGIHDEFLGLVSAIVPEGQTTAPPLDRPELIRLEALLGLSSTAPDDPAADPPTQMQWHFEVTGARHHVVALDNRTRRSFAARIGPPGNVGSKSLKVQVPDGPRPAGVEVLFIIAPLTPIGPSLIDDLIAPMSYRVFDMLGQTRIDGMPGTNPDAVEAWIFVPELMEELFARAEKWDRVIFLSGDVHHAASQQMSYWNRGAVEPARFAQFTSSGMRNVMPSYLRTLSSSFGFMQKLARAKIDVVRFGWDSDIPEVLDLPPGTNVAPSLRPELATAPVLLPQHGIPDGVQFARRPDWQWQMDPVIDERPDDERPLSSRIDPLEANEELVADAAGSFDDAYLRLATKHAQQIDRVNHARQIMFANNLGVVSFLEQDAADPDRAVLSAVHDLFATHPEADDPQQPEIHTRHVVALRKRDQLRPGLAFGEDTL